MFDIHKLATGFIAGICLLLIVTPAFAQADLISPETFSLQIDLRASITDGVESWTEGGSGKTRYGEGNTSTGVDLAEAGLIWQPRLSWTVTGYVHLQFEDSQDGDFGLDEAFLRYKPVPTSPWRWSGRAGFFYPPVSMEHIEEGWATWATITPSAINSWIGEEVKGLGIEARVQRQFGRQELAFTGGLFGANDTTGVLISYRGWSFHDIKTSYNNEYQVTVFPGHVRTARPFDETDDSLGYYARIDWSPAPGFDFNIIRWDNRADPTTSEGSNRAWLTEFVNVGASWQVNDQFQLIGQVMVGTTVVGTTDASGRYGLDFAYRAAFALLVREQGQHIQSLRFDLFEVDDRSRWTPGTFGENGWSASAAWRYNHSDHHSIAIEVLHVYSDRPLRAAWGGSSEDKQTQLQLSWRISY